MVCVFSSAPALNADLCRTILYKYINSCHPERWACVGIVRAKDPPNGAHDRNKQHHLQTWDYGRAIYLDRAYSMGVLRPDFVGAQDDNYLN